MQYMEGLRVSAILQGQLDSLQVPWTADGRQLARQQLCVRKLTCEVRFLRCQLCTKGRLQRTSIVSRSACLKYVFEMPGYGFTLSVWICGKHQALDGVMLQRLLDAVQLHLSLVVDAPGHAELVGRVHRSSF